MAKESTPAFIETGQCLENNANQSDLYDLDSNDDVNFCWMKFAGQVSEDKS